MTSGLVLLVGRVIGHALPEYADGWVFVDGPLIGDVGFGAPPDAPTIDLRERIVTPGFVDMHNHGGAGGHFADGPDAARQAADLHLRSGSTTTIASLVSAAPRELAAQVTSLRPLVDEGVLAGLHLEGPWISSHRHGAHDTGVLRAPNPTELARLLDLGAGAISMVTLAPELDGGIAAVRQLAEAGIVVAIGHTDASDAITRAAIDAGASVATHLFNAMPPMKHREPGPVGALLRDRRVTIELIADTHHIHPDVLAICLAAADPTRVALVTDAMAAAGSADGRYQLGTLDVTVTDSLARVTSTGALAGSTLTLHSALRHAVLSAGWPLVDAVTCATATPARVLGLTDRGRLEPGLRADIVILDDELSLRGVMRAGEWIVEPT
jgi:N-acetylglucosamine-6-phosphate deacetylase